MEVINRKARKWAVVATVSLIVALVATLFNVFGFSDNLKLNILTFIILFLVLTCIFLYISRPVNEKFVEKEWCQKMAKGIRAGKMKWFAFPLSNDSSCTLSLISTKDIEDGNLKYIKTTEEVGELLATGKVIDSELAGIIYEILTKIKIGDISLKHARTVYLRSNGNHYIKVDKMFHCKAVPSIEYKDHWMTFGDNEKFDPNEQVTIVKKINPSSPMY